MIFYLWWLFSIENNGKDFMKDSYQRDISYMRISLTDRCNYACSYCRPEIAEHLNHSDILSYEDLLKICSCAIQLGIVNFKITGGEPTIRKDYIQFIRRLKNLSGTRQVTLTTNGSLLSEPALDELKRIGIDGINFSIDSLNKAEYQKVCKKDCLDSVLHNLEYAYHIGIKVKINCVVDDTFPIERMTSFLNYIQDKDIAIRFIELMPLRLSQRSDKIQKLENRLLSEYEAIPYEKKLGNGPAHYYKITGYKGYVGFIEALHSKFCSNCNRIRLSSIGYLKLCLFYPDGIHLKPYLNNEKELLETMKQALLKKPKEHHFEDEDSLTIMNQIGG